MNRKKGQPKNRFFERRKNALSFGKCQNFRSFPLMFCVFVAIKIYGFWHNNAVSNFSVSTAQFDFRNSSSRELSRMRIPVTRISEFGMLSRRRIVEGEGVLCCFLQETLRTFVNPDFHCRAIPDSGELRSLSTSMKAEKYKSFSSSIPNFST